MSILSFTITTLLLLGSDGKMLNSVPSWAVRVTDTDFAFG